MAYSTSTKRSRGARTKPILLLLLVVVVAGAAGFMYWRQKHHGRQVVSASSVGKTAAASGPATLSAVESGLLPWQLQAPISRLAVFPGASTNQLVLAGGLVNGDQSTDGVFTLNTQNGALSEVGKLSVATHDAASGVVGKNYDIFGGGSTSSINNVEAISTSGTSANSASLPQPRSDAVAVTSSGTTYIIGGYNSTTADPTILATTDGTHFKSAGKLVVPVRYAAAAALNGDIYIFGGEAVSGTNAGKPVDTIQIYNPATQKVSVASWKLPVPLQGAMAFTIHSEMFLAGGLSTVPENIPLGVGTTQVPGVNVASESLTQNTIWAVNTQQSKLQKAGVLQVPASNAGVAVLGSRAWLVGGEYGNTLLSTVQMVTPNTSFGIAGTPGAGTPYYGDKLMIADRGNNRLLVMDDTMNITWRYPSTTTNKQLANGFYFPDDAFFADKGTSIISNQENNNTIIQLAYPSGKVIWTFGHPLQAGSAYGYLRAPDDAYELKNGNRVVADDQNCRVLFINPAGKVVSQIGTTGVCKHVPNVSLGSPNGDTPLYDGNVLISEIFGSWVSEYTPTGKMVWTVHLPISYPSDPQQLGASPTSNPDHYLIADYASPGAFVQFTREGKILSRYQPTSGPGMLSYPSLVEMLPSGMYMANDDHRDRMVSIDPVTKALVWQYGVSDQPGTGVGMLHKPDGFDILAPNGTTPTHGATK